MKKLIMAATVTVASMLASGTVFADRDDDRRERGFNRYALPDPVTDSDYYENGSPDPVKVELGRLLFFDKILSGNKTISCATCHHSLTATGDGLSLGVGEGGRGLGVTRDTGPEDNPTDRRIPRNAMPVFNLGAKEFTALFFAGRVEFDPRFPSNTRTELAHELPEGLDNPLAVQAIFPLTVATTMTGHPGENPIADELAAGNVTGPGGVWELFTDRVRAIPGYVTLFEQAFGVSKDEISIVHIGNAMAAFQAVAWRADNSPFDRYLRGDRGAMSRNQIRGMKLFFGKANCASCHSGKFQTDQSYHAIGMPQIGPGRGDGFDGRDDIGRERVTGDPADRYKFRTSTLRNIAVTGPWGHGGAFNTLEGIVRHHLNPEVSLQNYDCRNEPVMPSRPDLDALDCIVMDDPARVALLADANEIAPINLSDKEVALLIDFLHALTDPDSLDLRDDVPRSLPSGLPLAE